MIKQTLSTQSRIASDIHELKRIKREPNLEWLKRAYASFELDDLAQWSFIVLAGGKNVVSFRIRVAQSHLRGDMLPSFWSECALFDIHQTDFSDAGLFHLPLFQPATASYAPARNGLIRLPLKQLPDRKSVV